MPNYQNGKVYKIVSDLPEHKGACYVGSTCKTLCSRMTHHRAQCKKGKMAQLYVIMRQFGIAHFSIILVEAFPCANKEELRARERHHMELLNCFESGWNMVRSFVTTEEAKQLKSEYNARKKAEHKTNGTYRCELCNLNFTNSHSLNRHYTLSIHATNIYRQANNNLHCELCGFQTREPNKWKKHLLTQKHITNNTENMSATI